MKTIEKKYLRKGVIYLLIAFFDGIFSFFTIFLFQLKSSIVKSNPDFSKVLPDFVIYLVAFFLFLIFAIRGLILISRYLHDNVSFSKRTAIKYLYKNEDRIRKLINEEGKSRIDTPIMVIFTTLCTIIILTPFFSNLYNLITIEILNP